MKTIVAILLFSALCISGEKPTLVDSSIVLKKYNHKPSIKIKNKQKLKRLVKISPETASSLSRLVCNEPIISQRLTNKGQLLFYVNTTKSCVIKINALDGEVISKVEKK